MLISLKQKTSNRKDSKIILVYNTQDCGIS